jgi:hypothetical protein
MPRRFPILRDFNREERAQAAECPPSVPWDFIKPYESQAIRNHEQNLETLAKRGGLAPCEMIAVIEGRRWKKMPLTESISRLNDLVAKWEARPLLMVSHICRKAVKEGKARGMANHPMIRLLERCQDLVEMVEAPDGEIKEELLELCGEAIESLED